MWKIFPDKPSVYPFWYFVRQTHKMNKTVTLLTSHSVTADISSQICTVLKPADTSPRLADLKLISLFESLPSWSNNSAPQPLWHHVHVLATENISQTSNQYKLHRKHEEGLHVVRQQLNPRGHKKNIWDHSYHFLIGQKFSRKIRISCSKHANFFYTCSTFIPISTY